LRFNFSSQLLDPKTPQIGNSMPRHYRQVRRATIVQDPSGQTLKIGGYQADRKNTKDAAFSPGRSAEMPEQVDLRPYMSGVENQRDTNSCAANATAGAYEYLMKRLLGSTEDVSRLFIYYNARDLDGSTHEDEGTYISSCVKVSKLQGLCSEKTWPFEAGQILDRPAEDAYEEAKGFQINPIPRRVEVDLQSMKNCLAEGFPFIFGLQLFGSFQKAGPDGLVPMPDLENETHDGGHAMLCVGYSDADEVFIVRNSWGIEWGEDGYCYIPYAYMTDGEMNTDCWTLIRKADVKPNADRKKKDLSKGIQGKKGSLFSGQKAHVARAVQTPGAYREAMVGGEYEAYEMVYVEQLVYTAESGFISVEECGDLELLYSEEYTEEYSEESVSLFEEFESYEVLEEYEVYEYEESEYEVSEEIEDSDADESEDDESEDDESEEIEDSDADESEDEESEDEESEDEESEDEESEDEEIEDSDADESEDEESEDSDADESEDESEEDYSEDESGDDGGGDESEDEGGGDESGDDGGDEE
jgi:C1A family cysteine protease